MNAFAESLKEKRRKKFIFFLLSLLLHLMLFLCFLFFAFPKRSLAVLKKRRREIPASLKPRAGSLEDNVFFDFSQPKPKQQQKLMERALKESTTLPKQKKVEETTMPTPQQEKLVERKEDSYSKHSLTKESEEQTKVQEEPIKEEKKLTPEELKLLALQNLLKELPKPDKEAKAPDIKHITTSEIMSAQMSQPKQNISVSIPMGVPGIFQSKGLDLAERKGDDSKKPTFEDLKYVCYLRKIAQCLAQDIQGIFQKFNLKGEGKVEILFEIGRPGNLNAIETTISTLKSLEQIMTRAIKNSAPFPPLPKYFKKEYFFSKIELNYKSTHAYKSMNATIYALV